MKTKRTAWFVLICANAAVWCMLGFYRTTDASPREPQMPFANSIAQRNEMIEQLKAINAQLREQNELLKSGRLKVVNEVND
jgi:cell division protein FtsB